MTVVRTLVLAAALSAGFTGAAFARGATFTATLESPVQDARLIAQNTLWSCEGDTCVARPSHAVSVRACRQFAREAGSRVTAYGTEERRLSAEELARCNRDPAPTQQAQN